MTEHTDDQTVELDNAKVAETMKKIDICMMTTRAQDGHLHSRPMSNNRNVEWDGDSWFFAFGDSSQAQEVQRTPQVNLAYSLTEDIVFLSVAGTAEIVRDDKKKKELWQKDLEQWFPKGPEDDNVVLIKVAAKHIQYWNKGESGELKM